jgi:hypothetical protein
MRVRWVNYNASYENFAGVIKFASAVSCFKAKMGPSPLGRDGGLLFSACRPINATFIGLFLNPWISVTHQITHTGHTVLRSLCHMQQYTCSKYIVWFTWHSRHTTFSQAWNPTRNTCIIYLSYLEIQQWYFLFCTGTGVGTGANRQPSCSGAAAVGQSFFRSVAPNQVHSETHWINFTYGSKKFRTLPSGTGKGTVGVLALFGPQFNQVQNLGFVTV